MQEWSVMNTYMDGWNRWSIIAAGTYRWSHLSGSLSTLVDAHEKTMQ